MCAVVVVEPRRMLCVMRGLYIAVVARANRVARKQWVLPRRTVHCVPNAHEVLNLQKLN